MTSIVVGEGGVALPEFLSAPGRGMVRKLMKHFVARTCTQISERGSRDGSNNPSLPLEDFRGVDAFVLLGAPGTGKTTAFRREAERTDGRYVTARDFATFDDKPEWRGTSAVHRRAR